MGAASSEVDDEVDDDESEAEEKEEADAVGAVAGAIAAEEVVAKAAAGLNAKPPPVVVAVPGTAAAGLKAKDTDEGAEGWNFANKPPGLPVSFFSCSSGGIAGLGDSQEMQSLASIFLFKTRHTSHRHPTSFSKANGSRSDILYTHHNNLERRRSTYKQSKKCGEYR